MKLDCYPITYTGNKYRETKKYFKNFKIDQYEYIVEPMCGIFGFSRALMEMNPSYKGKFLLNDHNKELIDFHNKIKNDEFEEIENECNELLNKYLLDVDDREFGKEIKEINKFYIKKMFEFRGGIYKREKGKKRLINFKNKLEEYKMFMSKCDFYNLDFNEFINTLPKDKKILIFYDPPYISSSNIDYSMNKYIEGTKFLYDNTQMYIDIKNNYKNLPDHDQLMIINNTAIIREIFKKFNYDIYDHTYSVGNKNKTQHIHINNFQLTL